MAASVNKVILIGHLGADPEIRRTRDGKPIANLRLATSESWTDRNTGERKESTQWHTVVIFSEPLANVVERYTHKGSKLYVEGQLQTRKWADRDGNDRYSTEVVVQGYGGTIGLLDRKPEGSDAAQERSGERYSGERVYDDRDVAPRGPERSHGRSEAPRGRTQQRSYDDELADEVPF